MPVSSAAKPSDSRADPTIGHKKISKPEVKEKVSAALSGYTEKQTSRLSGASPDAGRHWIDGYRAPEAHFLLNLANAIPPVRDLLLEWLGARDVEAQSLDAITRALHRIAAGEGEEAHTARAMIAAMNRQRSDE